MQRMARRRNREPGLIDVLLKARWEVSASAAIGSYLLLRYLIPGLLSGSPLTSPLAILSVGIAPLAAGFFGLMALLVFFKQRKPAIESPPPLWKPPKQQQQTPHSCGNQASQDNVEQAWKDVMAKASPVPEAKPTSWTIEVLRSIEWKRFEVLTAAYFQEKTFRTEMLVAGPDGGIDVKLFMPGKDEPYALVQCKAWNSQKVGVTPIRELLGVMAHQKVGRGIFVTTGEYSADAEGFARGCAINLITGEMLLRGILALSNDGQQRLLDIATEGDYKTPTCASCGIKLVKREGKRGPFWGCRNYPKCRNTMAIEHAI